jgi:hypothetical protein
VLEDINFGGNEGRRYANEEVWGYCGAVQKQPIYDGIREQAGLDNAAKINCLPAAGIRFRSTGEMGRNGRANKLLFRDGKTCVQEKNHTTGPKASDVKEALLFSRN